MRPYEKIIIVLSFLIFTIALGSGIFDIYIQYLKDGLNVYLDLGKHSAEVVIALVALTMGILTALNGSKWGKIRAPKKPTYKPLHKTKKKKK